MKLLSSKLIRKAKRKQYAKYRVVLLVTDVDIERLEDLATVYCTKEAKPECELLDRYRKWVKKTYWVFHKLWQEYDAY